MLAWTNTSPTGASQTSAPGSATVVATVAYRSIWICTAQDLTDQAGVIGRIGETAVRTATSTYMKGLSEKIRIQSSSGLPWFWRRICFTAKGSDLSAFSPADTPISTNTRFLDTTSGIQRLFFNESLNNQPNTINNHDAIIFKGAKGVDWTDYMIAPIDTSRVSLKYDKTRTFQSGNTLGVLKEFKMWHPMNHNMSYADDESGDAEVTSYYSVTSKVGMGDYYVMDIIQSGLGATTSDLLNITSSSTLYWHEK